MKIDLVGGSYLQKYENFNSQRTINWYPVPGTPTEKNKNPMALFPTPGLTKFVNCPGRYFRGFCAVTTATYKRLFCVVDNILYEIFSNGVATSRGTMSSLGIGTTKVYMTYDSNNEVGIFSTQAGYVLTLSSNALTHITTNQYPGNVQTADYLDTYTIVNSGGSVYFNQNSSLLLDTSNGWIITNTYTPGFKPNPTIAVAALREEIFNFTTSTIEIYINDGTSPYSRLPRSTIYIGLAAKESLATLNDGFIFLAKNEKGECSVYMFDSYYQCVPISPFSINWAINSVKDTLESTYAYVQYNRQGNLFYYLTIPSLNQTFVYDIITKQWHERSSIAPYTDADGSYIQGAFRGKHYVDFMGMHLFGDLYSGQIYLEDYTNQTEDTNIITRTRVSQIFSEDLKNISVTELEIDCNTGQGVSTGTNTPVLMLQYSKDAAHTYSAPRNMLLGNAGEYHKRCRKQKLGGGRAWVFKLTLTDPVDLMIQAAEATGIVGMY